MGWFNDLFWSESLWLPVGYTWKDLESTPNRQKADINELYTIPVWVVVMLLGRYIFERNIATPFCHYLGIDVNFDKEKDQPYCDKPKSELNDSSIRRARKRKSARNHLKKATETCWRFVIYAIMLSIGTHVLFQNDWGLDNSKWIQRYIEDHEFTWDMKLYYQVELTFYLSLLISQFFDIKRKDFYHLFIHHVVTIVLLLVSYIDSTYRFGVVILYLHDCADVWMEAAKIANYAKIQKVCDVLFAVFGVVFITTRLIYYPTYVAYGYFNYNSYEMGIIHRTMVCLCYVLLLLHCYWGWLIGKMAYRLLIVGKVEKDTRSESESDGC